MQPGYCMLLLVFLPQNISNYFSIYSFCQLLLHIKGGVWIFLVISIVHMESVHVSAAHIKLFKGLAHKGGIFSHPLMCLGPSTDMMSV